MNEFQFANPGYLLALLALPLLHFGLARMDKGARDKLLRFLSESNLNQLLADKGGKINKGKKAAFWIGLVFLILALARPQANPSIEETQSTGLDIYVLLDVSKSMDAEDVAPSRLKKAKRTIQHLASRLSGDRMGIIAFANSAVLVSPLTNDYSILDSYLQNIDTSVVPSQGTNLGHALEVAKDAMDRGAKATGEESDRSNIFLVLSDGEDHGDSDLTIVDTIKKAGGIIFTVAFGTEKGALIPIRDDKGELHGYKQTVAGEKVMTAVKTSVLQEVANRGGGHFYFSTQDEAEVEDILARVNDAQRSSITTIKTVIFEEFFWIFLIPSLLSLLIYFLPLTFLLGSQRKLFTRVDWSKLFRSRRLQGGAIILAGSLVAGEAHAGPISFFWNKERRAGEESKELAKEKKFAEAADNLKPLQADNPDTPELNYNIGTYLLLDKKGQQGREQLGHLRNADGILRNLAQFNNAGSLASEGKKPEARAEYAELIQNLQRKAKLTDEESKLLALAKRNVTRLADPNQQPQQDQSQQQQQQQQDQQKQQNQQNQGQDSKNPQQGGKGDDKKDQKEPNKGDNKEGKGDQKDDKQKNDGNKEKDGDKKQEDKKDGGDQNKGQGENDKKEEKGQQPPPRHGGQPFKERDNMGEDDAKRILGALKEREGDLQKKFLKNKVKGGRVNVDDAAKDW